MTRVGGGENENDISNRTASKKPKEKKSEGENMN